MSWTRCARSPTSAAGHAANALSDLTGGDKVGIDLPRAAKVDAESLVQLFGGHGARMCLVMVDMVGMVTGKLVLAWPEEDALRLSRLLLHDEKVTLDQPDGESALAEAANIMVSACLSAVGTLARVKLLPSVPTVMRGPPIELARKVLAEPVLRLESGRWVIEARMFTQTVSGQLLLFPDAEGVRALLKQLEVA